MNYHAPIGRMARHIVTVLFLSALCLPILSNSAAAQNDSNLAEVCHRPGTEKQRTLRIFTESVSDHLRHGDALGPCSPLQETVAYTCDDNTEAFDVLYVRRDAFGKTDGTLDSPFGSVSAALDYAKRRNLPAVEVQVAPGVYAPDIATITRDTRLVAERDSVTIPLTVMSDGPHLFAAQGLNFVPNERYSAITVSHPDAETYLCELQFDGVTGQAVSQYGGSLFGRRLEVRSTQFDASAPADTANGTGIVLRGGVQATLRLLTLGFEKPDDAEEPLPDELLSQGNDGSGIYAEGAGTSVLLDSEPLIVSRSYFGGNEGCSGAIFVANGATLSANNTRIFHNSGRGIFVQGSGSQAIVSHLMAENIVSSEACDVHYAAAAAYDGADLYISGRSSSPFLLTGSPVALDIHNGSIVNLHHGLVTFNNIGAHLDSATDMLFEHEVQWIGNAVNYDGNTLPIPKPAVEWRCSDGEDDDGDGAIDQCDTDCAFPTPPTCG